MQQGPSLPRAFHMLFLLPGMLSLLFLADCSSSLDLMSLPEGHTQEPFSFKAPTPTVIEINVQNLKSKYFCLVLAPFLFS